MNPELLAPARNLEVGKAAVNCGADAVYIGAPRFSARREAANPVADIARLIAHAHRYMARVYVAVNTIFRTDKEVEEASRLLFTLHDAGVDGAIIQDMGLVEAGIPEMPIIASTQTHNADLKRIQFLESVGFNRVILARELGIDQIAHIRKHTHQIELEAFVHGALCMSYSGRCYLSDAIGGRSANRGECAQPCRKKYQLETAAGKIVTGGHLLSMKDLCRIDMLEQLLDAGVSSFKIEGRLKGLSYVTNVVSAYRAAMDRMLNRRENRPAGDVYLHGIAPDVHRTFHRGYVAGFATGDTEKMACFDTPKMMGEPIGQVLSLRNHLVRIKPLPGVELHGGDGICFMTGDGLFGTRLQKVTEKGLVLQRVDHLSIGATLYRNRDHRFIERLEKNTTCRKVPVRMTIEASHAAVVLRCEDATGIAVTTYVSDDITEAGNPQRMADLWQRQLQKSGDTEFQVTHVSLCGPFVPFMAISALNELRRTVLTQLGEARAQHMIAVRGASAMTVTPGSLNEQVDGGENVTNSYARRFFERCGATGIEPGLESRRAYDGRPVMTSKYCLRRELGICLKRISPTGDGATLFLRDIDFPARRLPLKFDCQACEMSVIYESTTPSND